MKPRFLFVAGLHRSGTSLVARRIAGLPGVSGITGAPVPENEGAYLQGGIPHTARHGIPGEYATDPAQHMTEDRPLNTLATRTRILSDWAPWFDPDAGWWVEKSPVTLTRMRLMQQLFPLSQFVVVTRHPQAVAAATAKWSDKSTAALLRYWDFAHRLMLDDLSYLHAAMILRYEDIVRAPVQTRAALAGFMAIDAPPGADADADADAEPVRDGNADYDLGAAPATGLGPAAEALGYLPRGECAHPRIAPVRHPLRGVQDAAEEGLAAAYAGWDVPAG